MLLSFYKFHPNLKLNLLCVCYTHIFISAVIRSLNSFTIHGKQISQFKLCIHDTKKTVES